MRVTVSSDFLFRFRRMQHWTRYKPRSNHRAMRHETTARRTAFYHNALPLRRNDCRTHGRGQCKIGRYSFCQWQFGKQSMFGIEQHMHRALRVGREHSIAWSNCRKRGVRSFSPDSRGLARRWRLANSESDSRYLLKHGRPSEGGCLIYRLEELRVATAATLSGPLARKLCSAWETSHGKCILRMHMPVMANAMRNPKSLRDAIGKLLC